MAEGRDPADGRKVLGSAPRANPVHEDRSTLPSPTPASSSDSASRAAQQLVDDLVQSFREQIRRAVGVELDDTPTSLAFVDHYLRLAQSEDREAIVLLVGAGAGAYYGELIRREIGAIWIGDGEDPRRLRLLVTPQFLYCSPVDQALQAVVACAEDQALRASLAIDDAFHVPENAATTDGGEPDGAWLEARLSERPPVPEDEFHTLTCRFETLQLMLELLASKHAAEGRAPREYGIGDYLDVIAGR
jgi:hypothetical protein